MHGFYAGDSLGEHAKSYALALVGDGAGQLDNPCRNLHGDTGSRSPRLFGDLGENAVADFGIATLGRTPADY